MIKHPVISWEKIKSIVCWFHNNIIKSSIAAKSKAAIHKS